MTRACPWRERCRRHHTDSPDRANMAEQTAKPTDRRLSRLIEHEQKVKVGAVAREQEKGPAGVNQHLQVADVPGP